MVLLHTFGVLDPCTGKDICRGDIIAASFAPTKVLPVLSIFVLNFTCQHVSNRIVGLDSHNNNNKGRLLFFRNINHPLIITPPPPFQNLFTVCNELQGLSISRLNFIIQITMGFCLLSYLLLSFGVYWTFGSYTLSDFLRNYPLESPYVV